MEGTINEFVRRHGMRHCRYRGQSKAQLQDVLTAIAVNIERLSGLAPAEEEGPSARRPIAAQTYLDQRGVPRSPAWWRPLHRCGCRGASCATKPAGRNDSDIMGTGAADRCRERSKIVLYGLKY
ncbi:transposase [Streptomyces sp. 13-12-16]|uniref:transposase n=1 Tax=Streptomyces sp. 13-12-16 TaxID=1570823 RepID=UPI00211A03E2|nr:transposase [Streptomyces sp. 13-12-16]